MLEKTIKLMVCGGMLTLVACSAQATEDNRGEFVRVAQSSAFDTDFTVAAEQTVNAVFKGRANVKTPHFHNGVTVWKDVRVQLSFPDCYEEN